MYVLTWIYGRNVTRIKEHPNVEIIQRERTRLKKEPQYKKGFFEIRTVEGLKKIPILKYK